MVTSATLPHPVKVTDSNATSGSILIVYNRNTGNKETIKWTASSPIVYDLANLGYSDGDVIEFSTHGKYEGSKTVALSGGKDTVTISSAESAAADVLI